MYHMYIMKQIQLHYPIRSRTHTCSTKHRTPTEICEAPFFQEAEEAVPLYECTHIRQVSRKGQQAYRTPEARILGPEIIKVLITIYYINLRSRDCRWMFVDMFVDLFVGGFVVALHLLIVDTCYAVHI